MLSPTTARHDRTTKRRLYAEAGIPWYWLVDPDARTVEALELHEGRWLEIGSWSDEHVARIAPFDGVELAIGRLFLPPSAPR